MKVLNAGRRDILKKRAKYIEDYDAKRARYDEQQKAFQDARDNHLQNIREAVIESIGADLLKPFGDRIFVNVEHDYGSPKDYKFSISYRPNDRPARRYSGSGNLYFHGVPFEVNIRVATNRESGNNELVTAPSLNGISNISAEDYEMLIHEIALFKRIDNIDWTDLIERAHKGVQVTDYITEPYPGSKDTSLFDTQLLDYDIARTQNSDNWLLVYVRRADSFDSDPNAPFQEVHDYGWMKLVKSSPAYYYFYWLREYDGYAVRHGGGAGLLGKYTQSRVNRAMGDWNICKLKKIYFSIPNNHTIYLTPDELCSEEVDAPKTDESEQP